MTLRMPGTTYLGPPDGNWSDGEIRPPAGMVVHIAEGSYQGTISWQRNPSARVSSYFIVSYSGDIAQMLDLDLMAWTQANGNPAWVGVENEGFHTQALTDPQVNANAQIFKWLRSVWPSIPAQVTNSPNVGGLGWHGMGGAAWGNHPNCLPLDITEVLTEEGWAWLRDVRETDHVASVAMDSGILTFDRPIAIVDPYQSRTVRIAGFEMTPEHRLYVHRSDVRSRKVLTAEEVGKTRTNWLIPCFGDSSPDGVAMDNDLLRLLVWVQADGHYENDGGQQPILHFHVAKPRKSERIVEILNALGVAYKYVARRDGTVSIRVRMREWLRDNVRSWLPNKTWESWILRLNSAQFAVLDREITQADGTERGGQRFYFSSIKKNVDLIQALYVTHGRAASIYETKAEQYGSRYVLNLHTRRKALALRDSYREASPGTMVGCLTTTNDTILIRQNGRVAVVGNCPGPPNVALLPTILARAVGPTPGQGKDEDMFMLRNAEGGVALINGYDPVRMLPIANWLTPTAFADYQAAGIRLQQVNFINPNFYSVAPAPSCPDCNCDGGGGGGVTPGEVANIVREELDNTVLGSIPGQLSAA